MKIYLLAVCAIMVFFISFALNAAACDPMNGEPEGDTSPSLVYDSHNNRFLMVYQKCVTSGTDIYGRLLKYDGTAYGNEILISGDAHPDNPYKQYGARAAYDSVNKKFLVVWSDDRNDIGSTYDIYGQFVNANGTLSGGNFTVSSAADTQDLPKIEYDTANQRFLVVWEDYRSSANYDIYGQLVNASGSLNGANFVISAASGDQSLPSVAYDTTNQRFLVTWDDGRVAETDIYGQIVNVNGTLNGSNFVISNAASIQWGNSLIFDSVNQRFLVSWTDWRNPCAGDPMAPCFNTDIYGQLVNSDGTLYGTASGVNFAVSTGTGEFFLQTPSAGFNSTDQGFLVAWSGDEAQDIFGQMVNADGTLNGSDINIADDDPTTTQYSPSVAYNPACNNFLTAIYNDNFSDANISLQTVGECQASPPSAPMLVSPEDGATGLDTTVTFIWDPSTDPDGDNITYKLSYCTDQDFTGCSPVNAASISDQNIQYAGSDSILYLIFAGMVMAGSIKSRKKLIMLCMVIILAGGILSSCGGGGSGGGGSSSSKLSYTAHNLNSGVTYYWKVTADDGNGFTTDSETRSFSTR